MDMRLYFLTLLHKIWMKFEVHRKGLKWRRIGCFEFVVKKVAQSL